MTSRVWDDAFLDGLRQQADPLADGVVAAYFADLDDHDPSLLFRQVVTRQGEDATPVVAAYLAQTPDPPAWLDPALLAAGQERFARWGPHVFTALYAAALPSAYACCRGVQVLGLTARLVTDAKRRLNETAQFHLDVMETQGLDAGGRGLSAVRHVRLMHAAVRWLIAHDARAEWDQAWGRPINQEDLLETLLTFTEVVFEVFDKTGVDYDGADADAYLHVWSYVGWLLGVHPDLLPLSRDDTRALMPQVRRRQFAPSEAGAVLTAALLDQGRHVAPPGLKGLPASTIRFYVGDPTADLLSVPPANWTRHLFGPLARATRLLSVERSRRPTLERLSGRMGLSMLELAVGADRGGARAPYSVPTDLAARWRVDVTGAPLAGGRGRGRRAGPA